MKVITQTVPIHSGSLWEAFRTLLGARCRELVEWCPKEHPKAPSMSNMKYSWASHLKTATGRAGTCMGGWMHGLLNASGWSKWRVYQVQVRWYEILQSRSLFTKAPKHCTAKRTYLKNSGLVLYYYFTRSFAKKWVQILRQKKKPHKTTKINLIFFPKFSNSVHLYP